MSEFPNAEDKDNWCVFLFDCPKEKVEKVIVMLFRLAKEIVPNGLPNYTMRLWDKDTIKISFRVLRDKNSEKVVGRLDKSIEELLERELAENIVVNPRGENAKISGWSKASLQKCKAYNRLSEFVVRLAEDNLFSINDRNEMRHLAINMLFMREAIKPFAFFGDVISGEILTQPFPSSTSPYGLFIPIRIERKKKE